jgi:hypothetical protein
VGAVAHPLSHSHADRPTTATNVPEAVVQAYDIPMDDEGAGLHFTGFMIDDRAVVFVRDDMANRRFLEGIDPPYWAHLARVHGDELNSSDDAHRQRAAAALRQAYGQGLETLFALLVAFAQAPYFTLGWMTLYQNRELRSVVGKIQRGESILSPLKEQVTWQSLSNVIHAGVPENVRAVVSVSYGDLWGRLAEEFLGETFEPEYNSLKHGTRVCRRVQGGFRQRTGAGCASTARGDADDRRH